MRYIPYSPKFLDEAVDFSIRSTNTSRSIDTWTGNDLTGMMAIDQNKIVGMIPYEKRNFLISQNQSLPILWVTGAYVEEEYRRNGIGTMLHEKTKLNFQDDYCGIMVYRDDETSLAYKWYQRNEFHNVCSIVSLKSNPLGLDLNQYKQFIGMNEILKYIQSQSDTKFIFDNQFGGHQKRDHELMVKRIQYHCYKEVYSNYYLLLFRTKNQNDLYVYLGETSMRDNKKRLEVLEYSLLQSDEDRTTLVSGISHFAKSIQIEEIRFQVVANSPLYIYLVKNGFQIRWRTNILAHIFSYQKLLEKLFENKTSFFDGIIEFECPRIKNICYGTGKNHLKLYLSENDLTRLLLNRLDLNAAIEDGRVVADNYSDGLIEQICKIFNLQPWTYYQIDYV